ncbi:MAG: hypothetical protein PGN19_03000 [Pseudomonas oryzihabitans]
MSKNILTLLAFAYAGAVTPEVATRTDNSLCLHREKKIVSFKTEANKKIASICVNLEDNYIVYRYGTRSLIELTYPAEASSGSWKNFAFNSYVRAGGEANDPKGGYSVSFTNNGTEYFVYQNWESENDDYEVGIIITHKGGNYKILGIPQSQTGSLARLEKFKNILNSQ